MAKTYLLASGDAAVVRTVSKALTSMEVGVEVCPSIMDAFAELPRKQFEGLIVDCDDMELAAQMFRGLRAAPETAHFMVIALVASGEGIKAAFASGANFALHKPVTITQIERSLRATRGLTFRPTPGIQ